MRLLRTSSKLRLQRGDTIVEVLIALAIITVVLVAAYASTNHSDATNEDTQEHSQALQLVQAQLEFLRGKGRTGAPAAGSCYTQTGGTSSACIFNADGSPDPGGATEPAFTVTVGTVGIPSPDASGTFEIIATWHSAVTAGTTNRVSVFYRAP